MSEPRRLRDASSDDVGALLRAVPPTRSITADEQARTRARLARHVAAVAVAGSLSWLSGAALGAGLGVVVGVASLFAPGWDAPGAASSPAATSRDAASATARAPLPPAAPSASPEPSAAPARAPSSGPLAAATSSAEPPADLLAEEVALLDRARGALGSAPAEALRLTEEHAARYPRGKLGVERELVAIDALRRLGRAAESRSRAEALLVRARGSLYEERIRKMLDAAR